jgi:hypothetical protein
MKSSLALPLCGALLVCIRTTAVPVQQQISHVSPFSAMTGVSRNYPSVRADTVYDSVSCSVVGLNESVIVAMTDASGRRTWDLGNYYECVRNDFTHCILNAYGLLVSTMFVPHVFARW